MLNENDVTKLYQKLKPYIARDFGGRSAVTISTGGGGGGGGGSFADLTGTIADDQAPQFLMRDGSRSLYGNLSVTSGVTIDGVDIDVHAANPDAHHDRASGGTGISVTGQAVSVDQTYGFVWTAQHQFGAGLLATHVGAVSNLTIDPTNDLTIDPGGIVWVPVAQAIRTPGFSSSFPIGGFNLNETSITGQSGLTIGVIVADELRVRVFVADETRVDRGEKYDSKSYGILAADFTTPSSLGGTVRIYFEDSPALNGAIFSNNDWLLFRVIDIGTGLTVASIWGQVSSYIDEANDQQSWLFTLQQGLTSYQIKKGRTAVDWGASGQALIHYSALDPNGAPYIETLYWAGSNPYTPANYHKTARFGNLKGTHDYAANAYGLLAGEFSSTWLAVDTVNGLRMMSSTTARLKVDTSGNFNLYNSSGSPVITLDNTGASFFTGVMTLGAFGGIYQGTGSFASPTTGLKIWNNSGVGSIGGYNTGVQQWLADTDGRIKAGQGNVQLGYYGLDLVAYSGTDPNPTENVRAVAFWDSLSSIGTATKPGGRIWGASNAGSGQYGVQIEAFHPTLSGNYPKQWLSWDGTGRYFVVTDVDHIWLIASTDILVNGPASFGSTMTTSHVTPGASLTYDLGSSGRYFRKLYVDEIVANTVTGGSALTGQIWQYDASDMYIRSNSGSTRTLYVTNPGAGVMNLDVEGSITTGGNVNGVPLASFYTAYGAHIANANAHHNQSHVLATTTGLGADHTVTGLTAGQVLTATGATTALFAQLAHSALSGLISDDHTQYYNQTRGDARYLQLSGGTMTGPLNIGNIGSSPLRLTSTVGTTYSIDFIRSDIPNTTRIRNGGGYIEFENSPKVQLNLIWHEGNDGPGSTLDADTVDGLEGSRIVLIDLARSITVQHSFSPTATQAPFSLGANAYNQAVIGLMADTLNKSVSTDATITGGGALTSSLTLGVNLANAFSWSNTHTWSSGSINLVSGDIQANGTAWLMSARRVRGAAGSVTLPTYSFSADTTTGMYSGGTGILTFAASATDVLLLNNQRIYPAGSGSIDIGDYNRKFRTLFVTELYAETLVAQSVMATIGGRIAVAPTTELIADLAVTQSTIDTKHNALQNGDYIHMEAAPGGLSQVEDMRIVSTATVIAGGYRYTVLRALNNGTVSTLIAVLGSGTTIDVNNNALASADTIYVTDGTNSEIMTVTSTATVIAGGYRYSVTRSVNGVGITGLAIGTPVVRITRSWVKGDAVIDTGGSVGAGYIDITSTSTIFNHLGPTMAIYSRTSTAAWNSLTPTVAIGNLRSFVDYTGDTFGWAVGNNLTLTATSGFKGLTGDATNGIRLFNVEFHQYNGSTESLRIDNVGMAVLATAAAGAQNSVAWYDGTLGTNLTSSNVVGYLSGSRASNLNNLTLFALSNSGIGHLSLLARNESGSVNGIEVYGHSTTYSSTGRIEYQAQNHHLWETTHNNGIHIQSNGVVVGGSASSASDGIVFTRSWGANAGTNYAEISNDRVTFHELMVVGNSSSGGSRRVGLWDWVQIGGAAYNQAFNVNGGIYATGTIGESWIGLSFTNSGGTTWTSFGSGFQAGQYKKFGDLVYVRGLAKRTAGSGTTIATLPSGYRPTASTQLFVTHTDTGVGRVDIDTSGVISLVAGGSGWVSLNFVISVD